MVPRVIDAVAKRLAAQLAARHPVGSRVVVAGHSAGAAAGCQLARRLVAQGVEVGGLVLIDGVESPNHLIARNLPHLGGLRVAAVLGPPSPCNRRGALQDYLTSYPDVRVDVVPKAGHGAIEGSGIGVYRRACGDMTDAPTADVFLATVVDAIRWAGEVPE